MTVDDARHLCHPSKLGTLARPQGAVLRAGGPPRRGRARFLGAMARGRAGSRAFALCAVASCVSWLRPCEGSCSPGNRSHLVRCPLRDYYYIYKRASALLAALLERLCPPAPCPPAPRAQGSGLALPGTEPAQPAPRAASALGTRREDPPAAPRDGACGLLSLRAVALVISCGREPDPPPPAARGQRLVAQLPHGRARLLAVRRERRHGGVAL